MLHVARYPASARRAYRAEWPAPLRAVALRTQRAVGTARAGAHVCPKRNPLTALG
jgi:hypothetical protein